MKLKLLFITIATCLMAGCSQKSDVEIARLQSQITTLSNEVEVLKMSPPNIASNLDAVEFEGQTNTAAQIHLCRLWVLDQMKTLELNEADKRYEMATNLNNTIFAVARQIIESKQ
jgi:outer membrane murein-binding lipoprotein Lpp